LDNSVLKSPEVLDKAAVALSGLCLLHCLALPLVLLLLPFLGALSLDRLHGQMLIVVIPVSVVALLLGFRRHRSRLVLLAGVVGMVLLIIGGTLAHNRLGIDADRTLTIAGAVVLAFTHYRNSRLARHCTGTLR
jgi:hypothetical protein